MRLFKEPLLYFLLAGFGLFVLYYSINPEVEDTAIAVDENSLMTFIQYRSKAFSDELAKQRWQAMSALERKQLLQDFYEEELLYREAESLGLLADDYIIKRRLVQKMEFIIQSRSPSAEQPSEAQLQDFMAANANDYRVQPFVSFTHVFLPAAGQGKTSAQALLEKLNRESVDFSQAGRFGERFLYHRNYIERTQDYVAAHFGEKFSESLFNLPADGVNSGQWLGPLQSEHGTHLVLLKQRKASYQPELAQVRSRVEQDYLRQQQQVQRRAAVKALADKYPAKGDAELIKLLQLGGA